MGRAMEMEVAKQQDAVMTDAYDYDMPIDGGGEGMAAVHDQDEDGGSV